jgi:hypothetical protein
LGYVDGTPRGGRNVVDEPITIFQVSCIQALKAARRIAGKEYPILLWMPSTARMMLRWQGPVELGGMGDLSEKAKARASMTGATLIDAAVEVRYRSSSLCLIY